MKIKTWINLHNGFHKQVKVKNQNPINAQVLKVNHHWKVNIFTDLADITCSTKFKTAKRATAWTDNIINNYKEVFQSQTN